MPGTTIIDELEVGRDGGGLPPSGDAGDRSDDGSGGRARVPARAYFTGMSLALVGILMFFMALVSSYIVRKADPGWRPVELPPLLWVNTIILVASSITLSRALGFLRKHDARQFGRWWGVTTLLGLMFLVGQVLAWRQLAAAGVFLSGNPASSFFYLLTGAHGLHLLGGVVALIYVAMRGWQFYGSSRSTAAQVTGVYWHFMDGLWVFLILILQLS